MWKWTRWTERSAFPTLTNLLTLFPDHFLPPHYTPKICKTVYPKSIQIEGASGFFHWCFPEAKVCLPCAHSLTSLRESQTSLFLEYTSWILKEADTTADPKGLSGARMNPLRCPEMDKDGLCTCLRQSSDVCHPGKGHDLRWGSSLRLRQSLKGLTTEDCWWQHSQQLGQWVFPWRGHLAAYHSVLTQVIQHWD